MRVAKVIAAVFAFSVGTSAASPSQMADSKESRLACAHCHKTFKPGGSWEGAHPSLKLQHMADPKRCVLCHDASSPDRLVMLDGAPLAFSDSSNICSQCHGLKFRDWKNGIHGKFLHKGFPDAHRLECVACHEAHSPKFRAMIAAPAPHRPKLQKEKRE